MKTVWKFVFSGAEPLVVDLVEPKVVFVGIDPATGSPAVWVEHEEGWTGQRTRIELAIVGTGHQVPDGMTHVGSMFDGPFVWHVYGTQS